MPANETESRRRRALTTAGAAALMLLSASSAASAAENLRGSQSTIHAIGLFAVAWFFSSLRLRKSGRGWRIGFQPSPLRDLPVITTPAASRRQGDVS